VPGPFCMGVENLASPWDSIPGLSSLWRDAANYTVPRISWQYRVFTKEWCGFKN